MRLETVRPLDPVLSLAAGIGLEEKTSKSKNLGCLLATSRRRFRGEQAGFASIPGDVCFVSPEGEAGRTEFVEGFRCETDAVSVNSI